LVFKILVTTKFVPSKQVKIIKSAFLDGSVEATVRSTLQCWQNQ